ncbi:LysM peptidoglycan-binding domain-containing protein [Thalassotalea sp. ND16A]|uniref:LysM peptidoglycan-binding domain-containing protein n=1 Tax=Thalassotalea sp. ND16A TaxID=1535422 RepID=UPI00051A0E50|nr:LysM peptidoglycan-binding domain-containing protein [Thalassotalea sp. ND16A]KGJ95687.1 hypothetical protein ND16A_1222 [Thalassotalea sp. ND16A]
MNKKCSLSVIISLLLGTSYNCMASEAQYSLNGNIEHQIAPNENLFTVSKNYNITLANLQAWNNIDDVNQVALGQRISLRDPTLVQMGSKTNDTSGSAKQDTQAANRQQQPPTGNNRQNIITEHVIAPGETLYKVSKTYNISMANLQEWNNIEDVSQVAVGQTIRLRSPMWKPTEVVQTENPKKKIETALATGEYRLAISLLTKALDQGSVADQQFALEFLGVAREKNGQKAFAKQTYQKYLSKYPDSETAARVKGRLDSLIGLETMSKDRTLKKGQSKRKKANASFTRGSLATDYRKGILTNDSGHSDATMSLVSVDLDARGRHETDDYDLGFRASLGHYQDLMDDAGDTSEQLRYLYISANSKDNLYQMQLGRQRSRGKGIFGRFDGVVLSTETMPGVQFNFVAGYPVASTKDTSLDSERKFYGLSMDVVDWWPGLELNMFVFEQSINDMTDRRAVGGEVNYYQNGTSINSMIDYDIFYSELNALLLSGSHVTDSQQRFSWSMNYRKSPYMSTRNALIGQTADSFAELQNLFITDEEILDLALDRTLESKSASVEFSQPFAEDYYVNARVTYMDLSGAPESGGVPEISETGEQYYYDLSLGANKLYSLNDNNVLGLRYSDLSGSEVYSIYATSRYRWNESLTIMPKLRYDNRDNSNGTSQENIAPTVRIQYQNLQHYFYSDVGAIFYSSESDLFPTQKSTHSFLYLGYRYYF